MLTAAEVIPFLLHEEGFVRRHAAEYLVRAHDPSPATAEDVWRGIDRYGMWGASGFAGEVARLPQTDESLWRAMGALGGTLDARTRDYLEEAVEGVGMDLLVRYREELLGGLQLSERAKDYLKRRVELAGMGVGELWGKLMELGREERPDEGEAKLLVEAIGGKGGEMVGLAMGVLKDTSVVDWREVFAVDVLGEVRAEGAVNVLLEKVRVDDDLLPERAAEALVRIGTAGVVGKVEAMADGGDWGVRYLAYDVLQRIKRVESEAALLRLLEGERDVELATVLGEGLCMLCAPAVVLGMLRDRVARGRLGAGGHDLEGMILAAGRMVGYEPPEGERWLEESRAKDARMDEVRAAAEREMGRGEEVVESGPVGEALLPWEADVTMPIERGVEKVGRNDPCPCGSGKKFKKCCGK